jgi:hypothetical protein
MHPDSSPDQRAAKAALLALGHSQWFRCRTAAGKRYGIRSSRDPNHYYLVDARHCTCYDGHRRDCKHQLAVRIVVEAARRGISVQQLVEMPAAATVDGLAEMVAERHGPMLDMIREPDGSIRWERARPRPHVPVTAADYDRIFGQL